MDSKELLRTIAANAPGEIAADAARALATVNGGRQRAINDLAARALALSPSPFDAATREALVAAITPSAASPNDPPGVDLDAELPRTRITKGQLAQLKRDAEAAGFTVVSKYIRWRLFG